MDAGFGNEIARVMARAIILGAVTLVLIAGGIGWLIGRFA